MNFKLLYSFLPLFFFISGFQILNGQNFKVGSQENPPSKLKIIVYFCPEIYPAVEEIRIVTYDSFFSAVTNRFSHLRNRKVLRVDTPLVYDDVDLETVKEIIKNNDADYAVVPKVKFFKVGIGSYVFSSQVVVSMKLYDAEGNLITESSFDTLKKNARLFGSAENSIKIGTEGALRNIVKSLRRM